MNKDKYINVEIKMKEKSKMKSERNDNKKLINKKEAGKIRPLN